MPSLDSPSSLSPGQLFGLLLAAALTALPATALGQEAPDPREAGRAPAPDDPTRFELHVSAGQRVGGLIRVDTGDNIPLDVQDAGSLGGGMGWRLGERASLELSYLRQETRLEDRVGSGSETISEIIVEYLHAGGRYVLLPTAAVRPFLRGGLGVLRIDGEDEAGDGLYPSLVVGGGALVPVSRNLHLSVDLRFFTSLLGRGATVPCPASVQPCSGTGNDTVLLQMQIGTAVHVSF